MPEAKSVISKSTASTFAVLPSQRTVATVRDCNSDEEMGDLATSVARLPSKKFLTGTTVKAIVPSLFETALTFDDSKDGLHAGSSKEIRIKKIFIRKMLTP